MSLQGIDVQYGTKEDVTTRGQLTYGVDQDEVDIDALQAQVADLEKRVPIVTANFARAGGTWSTDRIKGPASVNLITETLNGVTVLFDLNDALGFIGDVPHAISYARTAVGETVSTRDIAQVLTSSEVGDSINAGPAHIQDGAGANYAPVDGDNFTITVWSTLA
jgi:hypothetical protein